MREWLEDKPDLRTRKVFGVQEFLDKNWQGELDEFVFQLGVSAREV